MIGVASVRKVVVNELINKATQPQVVLRYKVIDVVKKASILGGAYGKML